MKIEAKFAMSVAWCTLLFLCRPPLARPANSPQDQGTSQTQSAPKGETQKVQPGPGKDVGKGGADIGKGAGKGAESLGRGTAGAAGNVVTLHSGQAVFGLCKGASGARRYVGVGA